MTVESSVRSLRVLVTGATGKLGQWLVPRLLAQGVTVRALTRQPERARSLLGRGSTGAASATGVPWHSGFVSTKSHLLTHKRSL